MRVAELKNSNSLAPFYIIKGRDAYLRRMAMDYFKSLCPPEYIDFNFSGFSLADGIEKILDSVHTMPMFSDYRFVVVDGVGGRILESDFLAFEKYLSMPDEGSVLIFVTESAEQKADEKFRSVKSLEKYAVVVDCERMTIDEQEAEIEKILSTGYSVAIERGAVQTLVNYTGGDMQRIFCELEKLRYFCDGKITREEVEELVSPEMESQIYELSNALGEGNSSRTMYILSNFFKYGISPTAVVIVLTNHYRRLLAVLLSPDVSAEEMANRLSVKPYAVLNLKKQAKNFTQRRLKEIVDYLEDTHVNILKGKIGDASALKNIVLNLM